MAWPYILRRPDAEAVGPQGSEGYLPSITAGIDEPPFGGIRGGSYTCPATGGVFGTPQTTHYRANAVAGPYETPIGDIVRAFDYGRRLPDGTWQHDDPEYFTIGFSGQATFHEGQVGCPPVYEGPIVGAWSWYMDSISLDIARVVESDGVWTPVLTSGPEEITSGRVWLPPPAWFLRPAELGPSPWVSDPADPMDQCLFTREELGVFQWSWNGFFVDGINFVVAADEVAYNVLAFSRRDLQSPQGSIVIGPGLGGWRPRKQIFGKIGPSPQSG